MGWNGMKSKEENLTGPLERIHLPFKGTYSNLPYLTVVQPCYLCLLDDECLASGT